MEGDLYIRICRAVKNAMPELHIHAFSPEEILYGSRRSGMTIREYLRELLDAGIGSLPEPPQRSWSRKSEIAFLPVESVWWNGSR